MADDAPGDWGRRIFLLLTALLLFGGLCLLTLHVFQQVSAPPPAAGQARQ